jgi:hypothetical protein
MVLLSPRQPNPQLSSCPPSPENDIECTEDFSTFDFESPANCCADAATPVDCGTASAATATVAFAPATKVDCGFAPATAVANAPAQTNMISGNTQDDTSFNARAFAMSLKRGEKKKYEGVSAAEETTLMCAQFCTTANIKSNLQVTNVFMAVWPAQKDNTNWESSKRILCMIQAIRTPLYQSLSMVLS